MITTLHAYITRELVKVTVLALVAFTLVLTVFAIIEPLREQGLDGSQVAALFAYTLPVMLSLTLPIGALFAASIVYGRFSQDNELLACRASGISTLSVLKPALALALVATAGSLFLSNFVAPAMAARAGETAHANFRGIAYNQLRSRKYIESSGAAGGKFVIHADHVDMDRDILYGVVGIRVAKGAQTIIGTASSTKVEFFTREGENYVAFDALNVSAGPVGDLDYGWEQQQPFPPLQVPNPVKEKASWHDWPKLVRTIQHPERDNRVAQGLNEIRQAMAHELFCREVAAALNAPSGRGSYRFTDGERSYVVQAASARSSGGSVVLASGPGRPITVMILEDSPEASAIRAAGLAMVPSGPASCLRASERLARSLPTFVTAEAGAVRVKYDRLTDASSVSIRLTQGVSQITSEHGAYRRKDWSVGAEMPGGIVQQVGRVGLDSAYERATSLGVSREVLRKIDNLKGYVIPSLMGKLIGEMHGRIAYGVSCFLLVAVGAALGLIFRGGQIISAFATSVLPAMASIVLIFMGKELARNPQVPMLAGLSVIWAGVAALAVACLVIYLYLSRK